MSFFNPDNTFGSPQSMMDVMISSLLFAFFGVMMFIGSVRYEMTYDKEAKWWRLCFIPLAVSLLFGVQKVVFMNNYGYQQTIISRKILIGHWLSIVIPVVSIGGILLYKFLKKRGEERRVY